jgi:SAM-dependent methyltransferase
MMSLPEKATIIHFHRHRVARFAAGSVQALGWKEESGQQKRFAALCEIGELSGKSVLDVGCGYGDLKTYLDRSYHGFDYVGIDHIAEFVLEARRRHGQRPGCYFCVADATTEELPMVDFVFASGLLSYRCEQADYYRFMIGKLCASARCGLAFNMLDADRFSDHPLLTGHDRDAVLGWCRELGNEVQVVDGYLDDDFTVLAWPAERRVVVGGD